MSIQFSGLGSGLPVNDWIDKLVAVQQAKITPLETKKTDLTNSNSALGIIKSSFESFKTSLKAFTDVSLTASDNLFSKKSASSNYSEFVSVTAGSRTPVGSYSLYVEQLATSTVTKSSSSVGKTLSGTTKFSEIKGAQTGTVSFTLNGTTKTITIGENDTMQTFMNTFSSQFPAVTVSLNNGALAFTTQDSNTFSVGMASDTSNFKNTLKLSDVANPGANTLKIASSSPVSIVNVDVPMVGSQANLNGTITAGKFKINGEEFEITDTTTINQIIDQINSNKNAGVSASFDTNTNSFSLISKSTGSVGISMEDTGNTRFFSTFKLDNTAASTTLGKDAKITINGSEITSSSNTVTNTGYDGLAINLLSMPSFSQEITLTVKDDLTDLKKATQTFVDAYNTIMNQVQEATKENGYLEMDSGLRGIYNELRQITSSMTDSADKVNLFAQIGITTGKVGMAVTDESVTLKFDTKVFDEMCSTNIMGVKKLLTDPTTGIMTKLTKRTEDALASEYGYFAARGDTFTKQIKLQDEKINKAYANLELYQSRLEKQFQAMDSMIAQLNNQYSSFLSTTSSS